MRWRLVLGGIGIAIGLALCVALLHLSGHGIDYVMAGLRRVDPKLAVAAGLAMAMNYMLGAKKWQRVEASLSGSSHTFVHACAATAIGMGVGQLLPTVVSSALVRGLGNRAVRRSARYGAIASGWEQLFDLAVAGLLVGPSVAALVFGHIRLALAASAAALLAGETCCVGAARLMVRLARLNANLATPSLSKFLWRVSLMRIVVLMTVTAMIGRAFALNIPPWELATAVPAVVLASVLSFIPAGLGVNELTFVGLLGSAGTPVPVAAAFALLNRTLQVCIASVLAVGGCALIDWRSCVNRRRAGQGSTERKLEL
ncbi:MAG TPA: lysylphosphatidylglycerol synthase transmembrane domain-containing protein [Steroidobacteraceae bacterium]|nr:lysylphosphatidylglycerol synthase transmembrane domain-containing protein [Steroidobacteraceae bacterium]